MYFHNFVYGWAYHKISKTFMKNDFLQNCEIKKITSMARFIRGYTVCTNKAERKNNFKNT